jgi:1,4-dihydroxy-2-naphthoate octaprenyltransferase
LLLLGVTYSALGRVSLKNRPIFGVLANANGHGALVYLLGASLIKSVSGESVFSSIPYALAVAAVFLATTVPDRAGDESSGKVTLAVHLGPGVAMGASAAFAALTLISAIWRSDMYLLVPSALSLPLYIAGCLRPEAFASRAAIASVSLLSAAAVVAYPWYALVLAGGYFGARRFFMWRFRMTYPTFWPGN